MALSTSQQPIVNQQRALPRSFRYLTHGVGFDRSYWNLPFNDFNYSYTNVAVDQYGFATFAYDRLGIGASQHGDPLNFVQSWTQIAALQALSSMLRQGCIDGIPSFDKVLHVGHSYGSIQAVAALKMTPNIWDGIALTGFSPRDAFLNFFELGSDFIEAQPLVPTDPQLDTWLREVQQRFKKHFSHPTHSTRSFYRF